MSDSAADRYFDRNNLEGWDGTLRMRTMIGKPEHRQLTAPLPCGRGKVPAGFSWDGSSVPWIFRRVFPRHRHPIASCRHDWRCALAVDKEQRKFADKEFERDVGSTSWKVTSKLGYLGVRVGAFFGIGSNF